MKNIIAKVRIEENRQLNHKTWLLRLSGYNPENPIAGQFVEISIPGKFLRRPISVHRYYKDSKDLYLMYDVVGEGTRILSIMRPGENLNLLESLGNGFSIPDNISNPVLLGGGIGVAPLYQLALDLVYAGKKPVVILGFNTKEDLIEEMLELRLDGIPVYVATVDGSYGTKGFVTDVITDKNIYYDYFYACGPLPMLKSVSTLPKDGELSLESRMGCGFGICMCCSIETKDGTKRICKEGPVFRKEELIWK